MFISVRRLFTFWIAAKMAKKFGKQLAGSLLTPGLQKIEIM
jgi:hypothetical protein